MGFLTKRTVSEVTVMDSLSSSDGIRYVTLKVSSEGAGRAIELDDQTGKCTLTFYHPDDLLRLAETAKQMWSQGGVMAPNDDPVAWAYTDAQGYAKAIRERNQPGTVEPLALQVEAACPTCGNERDELAKAEREIERLSAELKGAQVGSAAHFASMQQQAARASIFEAEVTRLNAALKWEQCRSERIGTHGPGCERWGPSHYECLLRKHEALEELLGPARAPAG